MTRTASARALAAALALGAVLSAPPVGAQDAQGLHLGVAGGSSSPTGALGDRARTGYNLFGNLGWQPHRRGPFALRAEAGYSHFGLTDGYLSRFKRPNEGDVSMLSGTLNAVWHAPRWGALRPYLIGGAGAYRRHTQLDESVVVDVAAYDPFLGEVTVTDVPGEAVVRSQRTTRFGLNGGGGVAVRAAGAQVYLEARYNDVFTTHRHTNFVPVVLGVRW